MLVEVASTMWPGSEFHASITRLEKKCRLSSNLALGFSSLSVCPLPLDRLSLMLKWVAGSTFTKLFRILKTSSRSALSRRFSSDISPVRFRRSSGRDRGNHFGHSSLNLFNALECPSLDRVTRIVSSTPDVVSLVLCTVVQQFVRSCVSQFCRCVLPSGLFS